jgi:hypothetical protein
MAKAAARATRTATATRCKATAGWTSKFTVSFSPSFLLHSSPLPALPPVRFGRRRFFATPCSCSRSAGRRRGLPSGGAWRSR